jgi:hypothetical protein
VGEQKATEANRDKVDEFRDLTNRAQRGDEQSLSALREHFDRGHLMEATGNLASRARDMLVEKYCGKNLLVREGIYRKMESLRAELAGTNPTPLEHLLVDRVVTCWLHLHHLEVIYAGKESMTLDLGAYYQRCITLAQKRYLSAIKTLAQIRKLALPVLQVNIARKQVNIAALPSPCPES